MAVRMNREEIMALIPHRDPFLLIDEINEIEPGVSCTATKYIREDEFWFQGHFPGHPVTPGVLLIEMMAQAGCAAMLLLPENKGKLGIFASIDKAKFRQPVLPGDTLLLEVEIIRNLGRIGVGKGKATVNGKLAASAELKFVLQDPEAQA